MVAQLINSKQVDCIHRNRISGRGTLMAEWANLESRNCWDINRAKPLREAISEANRHEVIIHLGSMLELCYLKHSEFAEEHKQIVSSLKAGETEQAVSLLHRHLMKPKHLLTEQFAKGNITQRTV